MAEDETAITREEFASLQKGLSELTSAFSELRKAETPKEKQEAREEIQEARQDLDALAKKLGISRDSLEAAMSDARKAERKEELRPILMELLDELEPEEEERKKKEEPPKSDSQKKGASKAEKGEEKTPKTVASPGSVQEPPSPDSEPIKPHWSDRRFSEILK